MKIEPPIGLIPLLGCCAIINFASYKAEAKLVINEINYSVKDEDGVEDFSKEWVELYNSGPQEIALQGWRISAGVSYEFPNYVIAPDSFVVVAANPDKFSSFYPDAPEALGPWVGRLSNTGETIRIRDGSNKEIDQVDYADEGFWASRKTGPEDRGHEGWVWEALHDSGGRSLELVNWADKNNNGQNWRSSILEGGTPGQQNSVYDSKLVPLIESISHFPLLPKSTEPVGITLKIDNSLRFEDLRLELFWKVDGAADNFASMGMKANGEGAYFAEIPEQPDKSVIEFFFVVGVGENESTQWPPPILGKGNVCNYLYMVDDGYEHIDSVPSYYVIMTDAERAELEQIGRRSSQSDSNAEMNCTFISFDGKGGRVRYLSSIRNRGASSRNGPPNNHLIKFRSDDPWNGQESIKFNCQYTHSQVVGSWLYQWLGVKAADSIPVKLHVNGEDLAESGGPRMFGYYARTESLDSNFVEAHWPEDSGGNIYQVRDDEDNGDEGDLKYEGDQADSYRNTYFKKTNRSVDDWSDIINLTKTLNSDEDPDYLERLSEVIDIDQWLHFLAVDSLIGNREGGLTTGKGDDYVLFRGESDQRFQLVPHDLDTVLDQGTRSGSPNLSIFTYTGVDGLSEFLSHPDIIPRYYAKFIQIIESKYRPELINPIIDRAVGSFFPSDVLNEMKEFVVDRRRGVLAQIQTNYSVEVDLPESSDGYYRTVNGEARFSGDFHVGKVKSVKVNAIDADLNLREGGWNLTLRSFANGGALMPGLNRVRVAFYDGPDGRVLNEEYIKLWNDTGKVTEVSGDLTGTSIRGNVFLTTRGSYIPKVPFLVRVDVRDSNGSYLREVWDASVTLTANRPGIRISPNVVNLRNGLGSALVTVQGGGLEEEVVFISEGAIWSYLDNGSDQGALWQGVNFDDSGWQQGRAELGYGDDDEVTELSFGPDSRNKYATTYFRSEFYADDIENISTLGMRLKYDDGAIIYINGKEFFKTSNMESGMAFDEFTVDGDDTPTENFQEFSQLSPDLLVLGKNVIAVEIKQGDDRSSDVSFDLQLSALISGPSIDPGDLNLNVEMGQQRVAKSIISLGPSPDSIEFSGVLEGAVTNWSGVVRVIGDVTVPKGHILNILPGTIILLSGDEEPQSSAGSDLIIAGSINCVGNSEEPITFTSSSAGEVWGQILFDESEDVIFKFTNIHHGGHSPKGGHTDHGRVLRVLGSSVVFEDCTISDNRGKVGQANAQNGMGSSLVFRRCHWARSVMGFETFDTGVLLEDSYITDMLGVYREDNVTDDNDAIYLHEARPGQELILKNVTVAYMDDDGIDTLGADVLAEGVICRNCSDKGISVFGGSFQLNGGLLVNNGIGISAKDDADVVLNNVTVSGNDEVGLQVENKDGDDEPSRYLVDNCILWGNGVSVRTDYSDEDILVNGSIVEGGWEENQSLDPLFRNSETGDFRLSVNSPAIVEDSDEGKEKDVGFYDFVVLGGEVRWELDGSPYYVTDDVKVPDGVDFYLEAGVSVYVAEGVKIEVEGKASIVGDPERRIQFSHFPGAQFVKDEAGDGELPDGPPKWRGLKLINTLDLENTIMCTDFESAQDEEGAIGVIKSQCVIDDVSFSRTHIRMIYTEDASIIIRNTKFPDMFTEEEKPAELGLDNISEHIKGIGEIPEGGRYIIRNNYFGRNKGHNDVIDVDSGWRPDPIVQIIGNYFAGAGDELCDLGGDVYLSENVFLNVFKDDETSDRGYANAISTGDVGPGATFSISRNIFSDVDHAISLKIESAAIFENNTVYKIHPDFDDRFDNPSVASVVNLFIPTDTDSRATHGKGAYLTDNILVTPRVFSGADDAKEPPYPVTPLELVQNLLDPQLSDLDIGRNHEGVSVLDLGEKNTIDLPLFTDPESQDFKLHPASPARGSGRFGQDLGALVPSGIFISGEPPSVTTDQEAVLMVGGPGYFAYRWRFKDAEWSEVIEIGDGFNPLGSTVRSGKILLKDLLPGIYSVEVFGQDFAGNWQETPTQSEQWEIVESYPDRLVLNEVLISNEGVYESDDGNPSYIELYNSSPKAISLDGYYVSSSIGGDSRIDLDQITEIEAWGYLLIEVNSSNDSIDINKEGGSFYLFDSDEILDSIDYGYQAANYSIGRYGRDSLWVLNVPTPGVENREVMNGDPSGLRISEWLANPGPLNGSEFIELVNDSSFPVTLTGISLSDSQVQGENSMLLPELSFIAPNHYVTIKPKGFKLSTDLDQIVLTDTDGSLLDNVIYGPQIEGLSEGKIVGSDSYQKFIVPTPGVEQPVKGSDEYLEYERLLEIYNSLRIIEIMYNPLGGSEYEFIELQNVGDETLNLNGISFVKGIEYTFDEILLSPKESVVLASNLNAFTSRYGEVNHLIDEYAGRLNNGGEELILQLPDPYPFNMVRFSFNDQWYSQTDGEGHSLELRDLTIDPSNYNSRKSWVIGSYLGSPHGIILEETYKMWSDENKVGLPYGDDDGDGLINALEYVLGGGVEGFDQIELPRFDIEMNAMIWEIGTRLAANDYRVIFEYSDDLKQWNELPSDQVKIGSLMRNNVVRLPSISKKAFLRLRLDSSFE